MDYLDYFFINYYRSIKSIVDYILDENGRIYCFGNFNHSDSISLGACDKTSRTK